MTTTTKMASIRTLKTNANENIEKSDSKKEEKYVDVMSGPNYSRLNKNYI